MLGALEGTVRGRIGHALIVMAGGAGYKVNVTQDTAGRLADGDSVFLWTHLAVREDAMELFGFPSKDELAFFEQLLLVSGIGPRSALGIVGLGNLSKVKSAIAAGDSKYLTTVSGIGRKSAEKIVIELRDKVTITTDEAPVHGGDGEVFEALGALGYTPAQAREALEHLSSDTQDTKGRLREALKYLGKK